MWTRALLKSNAKICLRRGFWTAVLACLAYGALTDGLGGLFEVEYKDIASLPPSVLAAAAAGGILGLALHIFLFNPLLVGLDRRFMEARVGDPPFTSLFGAFHAGDYGAIVKTLLLRDLWVFLYSLLLFIPGIIKAYAYHLVPWLLAENPRMPAARARQLSQDIMDGEKWNVFVLELSFLGWELLALLAAMLLGLVSFGLLVWPAGVIFGAMVQAYRTATDAELYAALREKALAWNLTDTQELSGFVVY